MPHLTQNQIDGLLANLSMVLASPDGINSVAKAVLEGDLTIEDLKNTGQLSPLVLNNLHTAIDSMRGEFEEENAWQDALRQNRIVAFENYISLYPNGNHASIARTMIAGLRAQEQFSQRQSFLDALRENINAYSQVMLRNYGISFDDIVGEGIALPARIRDIWNDDCIDLQIGETPESIP